MMYSMPRESARYTTLCGVVTDYGPDTYDGPDTYHLCLLRPKHIGNHMCECGHEWRNQVGDSGN